MASMMITVAQTVSGNSPKTREIIEEAAQTFLCGTPVMIDATDGGVKEWAGTPATDLIAGFSGADAFNLASTGLGAPAAFAPATGIGSGITFGSVPYQPSAKNIPRGQPFCLGRTIFFSCGAGTVFEGQVGPAQTTVAADVGKNYGMTKDSDNHWYIDRTKTGANACVTIQALEPNDGPRLAGRVLFTVMAASVQLVA